jgi:hypothetical protein
VAVEGVGKVGSHLVTHLIDDGASVTVYDINDAAVQRVSAKHPAINVAPTRSELVSGDADIYAPCALGGAIDDGTVAVLRAKVICGGANNQLAHAGIDKLLEDHGIVYAPDYVVNAGGVIQVGTGRASASTARGEADQISRRRRILALAGQEAHLLRWPPTDLPSAGCRSWQAGGIWWQLISAGRDCRKRRQNRYGCHVKGTSRAGVPCRNRGGQSDMHEIRQVRTVTNGRHQARSEGPGRSVCSRVEREGAAEPRQQAVKVARQLKYSGGGTTLTGWAGWASAWISGIPTGGRIRGPRRSYSGLTRRS